MALALSSFSPSAVGSNKIDSICEHFATFIDLGSWVYDFNRFVTLILMEIPGAVSIIPCANSTWCLHARLSLVFVCWILQLTLSVVLMFRAFAILWQIEISPMVPSLAFDVNTFRRLWTGFPWLPTKLHPCSNAHGTFFMLMVSLENLILLFDVLTFNIYV